jgi:hypothetical protein
MTNLNQLPGELNVKMLHGDDLSFDVEFTGMNLSTYTFSANVTPAGQAPTLIPITITPTDLPNGKLHFFISRASVASLPTNTGAHSWLFSWTVGTFVRGVLAGTFYIEEL